MAGPDSPGAQIVVEVRQLGGALTRPGEHPSAYDHRAASYSLLTIGLGVPPVVDTVLVDALSVLAAMRPWTVAGSLPNFRAINNVDVLRRAYTPPTLGRLARLAAAYDPRGTVDGAALLAEAAEG